MTGGYTNHYTNEELRNLLSTNTHYNLLITPNTTTNKLHAHTPPKPSKHHLCYTTTTNTQATPHTRHTRPITKSLLLHLSRHTKRSTLHPGPCGVSYFSSHLSSALLFHTSLDLRPPISDLRSPISNLRRAAKREQSEE